MTHDGCGKCVPKRYLFHCLIINTAVDAAFVNHVVRHLMAPNGRSPYVYVRNPPVLKFVPPPFPSPSRRRIRR